jgi:hypothetical protein
MTDDKRFDAEIRAHAFDVAIRTLAHANGVDYLLSIPGVWELVAEDLNNDALAALGDDDDAAIQILEDE